MAQILSINDAQGKLEKVPGSKQTWRDEAGNTYYTAVKEPGTGTGHNAGKPPVFNSPEELISRFEDFIEHISDIDYAVFPTKRQFAKFLGITQRTLYNYIDVYFPEIKKQWQEMLADCISEGITAGKYPVNYSIFAEKNLCGWTDRQENTVQQTVTKVASKEEAREALKKYAAK